MPWENPELETDPDAATLRVLDGMAEKLDGWEAHEGSPEVVLAEEIGRESAVQAERFIETLQWTVAGIGESVYGLPGHDAATATIDVAVTVSAVGDEIPDGFTVSGINDSGADVVFTLSGAVTATSNPMTVTMTSVEAGAHVNGPIADLWPATATATVVSTEAIAPAAGGRDEEALEAYLDRFVGWLSTLRPGGVRAVDLELLARAVPGVHRALAVDLYNPDHPGVVSERCATVFAVDAAGAPVASPVAALLQAELEAVREINFLMRVGVPTYHAIEVEVEATAQAGADPTAVGIALAAALASYLSPGQWGVTATDDQSWVNTSVVRYLDVVRAVSAAPGVARLDSLTLNGGTGDVAMSGAAPLPASTTDPVTPSTIVVTVE